MYGHTRDVVFCLLKKLALPPVQVKSVSINRDTNLLLTGTSKSVLSIFDVRQPQKSIEARFINMI